MGVEQIDPTLRAKDLFHTVDAGFINHRLCLSVLPPDLRTIYTNSLHAGADHLATLANNHQLITTLLIYCEKRRSPTLIEALEAGHDVELFRSTHALAPCPEVYTADRVTHDVVLGIDFGKPVRIAYHTKHIANSTGKMTLALGAPDGYRESIVGILHDKPDRFEIEPLIIGSPWYEHRLNKDQWDVTELMWAGAVHGEILPEDIAEFSGLTQVTTQAADEWLNVMQQLPEGEVKKAFTKLLREPWKSDWAGESNDHYSANITVGGRRRTAAFLLKGPGAGFRPMTLEMCGKRADQVYRLTKSGADISIVQHAHQIEEAVRETLRSLTVMPGRPRKYCLIDGQATYRILKAYSLL